MWGCIQSVIVDFRIRLVCVDWGFQDQSRMLSGMDFRCDDSTKNWSRSGHMRVSMASVNLRFFKHYLKDLLRLIIESNYLMLS